MKLITLNTWGGRIHAPLMEFLLQNKDADIFCLQEIYHNATEDDLGEGFKEDSIQLHSDIGSVLIDHVGYFRPSINGYGLSIFIKKDITINKEGDILIYEVPDYVGGANHPRNLQYMEIEKDGSVITIANVHGLWNGQGKTDTEHRLEQSRRIKAYMDSITGKKILCGDFNLRPDTESVSILEDGMRNLIKEYAITSTRTSLYTKSEKFADYIFVSPEMTVLDFKVLPDEVSDHSPLFIEFT